MDVSYFNYESSGYRLTKPLQIGEFSCDAGRDVYPDDKRNLRYLINPEENDNPRFDLDVGYDQWIRKDPKDYQNNLLPLQKWAISKRNSENNYRSVFANAEIVCGRGALTTIARTPYTTRDKWRVVARRFEDVIYINDCGASDGTSYVYDNDRHSRCCYWGEHISTIMSAKSRELVEAGFDVYEKVNDRETYSTILRSDIIKPDGDRIKLTYSSNTKAIDNDGKVVAFKTLPGVLNDIFWQRKAWFWWLQGHLGGVDRVYAGIRSPYGVVYKIEEIPHTRLRSKSTQKCDGVMNFLASVLSEIKDQCFETLQIRYDPMSMRVHFENAEDADFLIDEFTKFE